jgi:hypothetical protein
MSSSANYNNFSQSGIYSGTSDLNSATTTPNLSSLIYNSSSNLDHGSKDGSKTSKHKLASKLSKSRNSNFKKIMSANDLLEHA